MSSDIENYIFDLSRELNIENTHGVFGNELELIALVRNCPFLYDKSRTDFKDLQKKEATWGAIASIMHCSISDCKTRWKSLREQYAKIKKALSSNDADSTRLIQWEYIEDMKFLDEHIKPRRKFHRNFMETDTQRLEQDEEYRIEWLDEGKNYDSRELKLINLVKSCPLLYNKNNFDHKDPVKKEQAWMSISKILGIPALDCKTRWKTMRERYARERKWQTEDPNRKPWIFYDEMSFLDSHVRARRYINPLRSTYRPILPKPDYTAFMKPADANLVTNSGLPDTSPAAAAAAAAAAFQVQKMEFIDPSYHQNCASVDSADPISMSPNSGGSHSGDKGEALSPPQDEDDLFGQSIAAELKRITGRRKKMRLKADIFKLLCEAESDTN